MSLSESTRKWHHFVSENHFSNWEGNRSNTKSKIGPSIEKVLNLNKFPLKPTLKKARWPHMMSSRLFFPFLQHPLLSANCTLCVCFHPEISVLGATLWSSGSSDAESKMTGCVCFLEVVEVALWSRGGGFRPLVSPPVGRKKAEGKQKEKLLEGNDKYRGSSSFRTSSSTNWRLFWLPLGQVAQPWAPKVARFR